MRRKLKRTPKKTKPGHKKGSPLTFGEGHSGKHINKQVKTTCSSSITQFEQVNKEVKAK